MADWQPIETAPKDREIIGRGENIPAVAMKWDQHWPGWWRDNNGYGYTVSFRPTHWMELPEAPEAGDEVPREKMAEEALHAALVTMLQEYREYDQAEMAHKQK